MDWSEIRDSLGSHSLWKHAWRVAWPSMALTVGVFTTAVTIVGIFEWLKKKGATNVPGVEAVPAWWEGITLAQWVSVGLVVLLVITVLVAALRLSHTADDALDELEKIVLNYPRQPLNGRQVFAVWGAALQQPLRVSDWWRATIDRDARWKILGDGAIPDEFRSLDSESLLDATCEIIRLLDRWNLVVRTPGEAEKPIVRASYMLTNDGKAALARAKKTTDTGGMTWNHSKETP